MQKAMVIALGLAGLLAAAGAIAEERSLPVEPLTLLPGMSPMRSISPPSALPTPVITDLSNTPNPFDSRLNGLSGQTALSYTLAGDYNVTITLYDLVGYRVRSWDYKPGENGGRVGPNTVLWDGTSEDGRKVAKGGYLAEIQIETPQTTVTAIRKIGVIH